MLGDQVCPTNQLPSKGGTSQEERRVVVTIIRTQSTFIHKIAVWLKLDSWRLMVACAFGVAHGTCFTSYRYIACSILPTIGLHDWPLEGYKTAH